MAAAALGGAAAVMIGGNALGWGAQPAILVLTLFLLTPIMGEPAENAEPRLPLRQLRRIRTDARLAGICTGLARCTPQPDWAWRLAFLITSLFWGLGILAYIGLWLALNQEPQPPEA